jgi:autoinducer 2-degrading protein
LFAVHVTVQVKPDCRDEFLAAIEVAARSAVRDEPGCLAFDVIELDAAENRFALWELYTDQEAVQVGHRQSAHFKAWRLVADRVLVPGSQVNTTGSTVVSARESTGDRTEAAR